MALRARLSKPLLYLIIPISVAILGAACFGGSDAAQPTPDVGTINRPAISRSGATPTETPIGGPLRPQRETPTPGPDPAQAPVEGLIRVTYTQPFIWPVIGDISSFMGPEHPNGIDIAFEEGVLPQIRAAAGGTVTHAGGDDDQPLGISVVIDHGNGVTTTYGHLSELIVKEGDVVKSGDPIGIGGSTGQATGPHLHFEVRKDGATVDPLDVLPPDKADTEEALVDCESTPLTLPSGSQAVLNLDGVLEGGEQVMAAGIVARDGAPQLQHVVLNGNEVQIGSDIDFNGPNELDSYDAELTIDNPSGNRVLSCPFEVQRREVATTFYERVYPPASDLEGNAGTEQPTPEPTATPTPGPWAQQPSYETPATNSGSVQAPSYGVPAASGGGGAQSPSYGFATATPTPKATATAAATGSPEPTATPSP